MRRFRRGLISRCRMRHIPGSGRSQLPGSSRARACGKRLVSRYRRMRLASVGTRALSAKVWAITPATALGPGRAVPAMRRRARPAWSCEAILATAAAASVGGEVAHRARLQTIRDDIGGPCGEEGRPCAVPHPRQPARHREAVPDGHFDDARIVRHPRLPACSPAWPSPPVRLALERKSKTARKKAVGNGTVPNIPGQSRPGSSTGRYGANRHVPHNAAGARRLKGLAG